MQALKDKRKREQVGYPLSTAAVGFVGYNSEKNGYTTKESKIAYYEQARKAMEIGQLSVKATFDAHYNDGVVIAKVANVPIAVLTLDKHGDIITTFPPEVLEAQADFLDYVNGYYRDQGQQQARREQPKWVTSPAKTPYQKSVQNFMKSYNPPKNAKNILYDIDDEDLLELNMDDKSFRDEYGVSDADYERWKKEVG